MTRERYSAETVARALTEARGIKADAARALGCSRRTISHYIERYPSVKEAYDSSVEILLDDGMGVLAGLVDKEYWPAVRFLLSTLGKGRGFTERAEAELHVEREDETDRAYEAAIFRVYGRPQEDPDARPSP